MIYDKSTGLLSAKTENDFDIDLDALLHSYEDREVVQKCIRTAANLVKDHAVLPFLKNSKLKGIDINIIHSANLYLFFGN